MSLDKGEEVIDVILLDFSSAFDTINHDILLKRLEHKLGIYDQALKWFQSYLLGRSHRVIIGNERSSTHSLTQGVPQGSVLGPILFTLYISPLESIIDRFHIQKMFYADDTQLYVSFKKSNDFDPTTEILNCIHAIKEWSQLNSLKLNSSKTEFLHISSRFRETQSIQSIDLDGTLLHANRSCRNLGVDF